MNSLIMPRFSYLVPYWTASLSNGKLAHIQGNAILIGDKFLTICESFNPIVFDVGLMGIPQYHFDAIGMEFYDIDTEECVGAVDGLSKMTDIYAVSKSRIIFNKSVYGPIFQATLDKKNNTAGIVLPIAGGILSANDKTVVVTDRAGVAKEYSF